LNLKVGGGNLRSISTPDFCVIEATVQMRFD